jgi:hypothetical protein
MRGTIAVVAGLITAALWVALIQGLGHWLYPPPAGLDTANAEDVARIVAAAPFAAKLFVVAAWFFGTLAGGMVANAISRRWWSALIIAGIVIAFASIMTLTIPHPMWMKLAGVAAPLLAAELANRLVHS